MKGPHVCEKHDRLRRGDDDHKCPSFFDRRH